MSHAGPRQTPEPVCMECGAPNDRGASECWLCQRRNWFSDAALPPAKTDVAWDAVRSRLPIGGIIVVAAILILCAGMALDLGNTGYFWLYLLPVLIPVAMLIWSRFQKRPRPGQPMTNLEFATALTTIAVATVLLGWLVWAGAVIAISFVLPFFLALACVITAIRARRLSLERRPMNVLQKTASIVFLAVVVPGLLCSSLMIALGLICMAIGPPSH